jgi:hypothetical protein
VNSASNTRIATLADGDTIDLDAVGPRINIRATPDGAAGSLVFKWNGRIVQRETYAPYSIGGDDGTGYNDWALPAPGPHTLEVLQYSGAAGTGSVVGMTTLRLTVLG